MTRYDLIAAVARHGISTGAIIIYALLAVVGIGGMFFILRNYHRQGEFESSDHVVPEDYD